MFAGRTNWDTSLNRLSALLLERRREGKPVLDLTASNPTQCGFTYDERGLLSALANPALLRYDPDPRGLDSALRAVQSYYGSRRIDVSPEQIVLTTGTSEAYAHVFRLLADPGNEVLVPAPSYPLFDFLADICDVKLTAYSLRYDGAWRIDLETVAKAITSRTRAIIVVTPNNPTGSVLRREELEKLTALACEHRLALIADEVFGDYIWTPDEDHAPSMAQENRCLTFTLSGLSKISALPQIKLGWIVVNGPSALRCQALERLEVIADTYLSVSTPAQLAAEALLDQREDIQWQISARIRKNRDRLDEILAAGGPCSRLRAEGGWYAVLRLPNTRSDEQWALDLLGNGVYVHPGHFFGFPSGGHLVLSLITREEEFSQGVKQLLETVNSNL